MLSGPHSRAAASEKAAPGTRRDRSKRPSKAASSVLFMLTSSHFDLPCKDSRNRASLLAYTFLAGPMGMQHVASRCRLPQRRPSSLPTLMPGHLRFNRRHAGLDAFGRQPVGWVSQSDELHRASQFGLRRFVDFGKTQRATSNVIVHNCTHSCIRVHTHI